MCEHHARVSAALQHKVLGYRDASRALNAGADGGRRPRTERRSGLARRGVWWRYVVNHDVRWVRLQVALLEIV